MSSAPPHTLRNTRMAELNSIFVPLRTARMEVSEDGA